MMKTIGIKLADGSFYPIIGDDKPTEKSLELTTVHNNQTKIMVDLYRSEACKMNDAEYIDSLQIENLVAHPNGEPDITFTLSIDENKALSAKIQDTETGNQSSIAVNLPAPSDADPVIPSAEDSVFDTNTDEPPALAEDGVQILKESAGPGLLATAEALLNQEEDEAPAEGPADEPQAEAIEEPATESVEEPAFELPEEEPAPEATETAEEPAFDLPEEPETESVDLSDFDFSEEPAAESTAEPAFELPEETEPEAAAEPSFELPDEGPVEPSAESEEIAETEPEAEAEPDFSIEASDEEIPTEIDIEPLVESEPVFDEEALTEPVEDPVFDDEPLASAAEEPVFEEAVSEEDADALPDFEENKFKLGMDTEEAAIPEESESEEMPDFSLDDIPDYVPETEAEQTLENNENVIEQKGETMDDLDNKDEDISSLDLPDLDIPDSSDDSEEDTSLPDFNFDLPEDDATQTVEEEETPNFDDFDLPDNDPVPAASGGFDFAGLYDDNSILDDEEEKSHTKAPLIICIICAIICLLATAAVLFIIPSKYNLLTRTEQSAEKTVEVVEETKEAEEEAPAPEPEAEPEEEALPEPEPEVEETVPSAQEEEIIVIEKAEEVIPEQPPVIEEKPKNIVYKIKWGDTLWDIADTYYKNPWRYKDIAKYNGIKDPDHIVSGTFIEIPAE